MTQTAINYRKVLYGLGVENETVEETKRILSLTPELTEVFNCPVISVKVKHKVIEKIFPPEIRNFLRLVCDYRSADKLFDIFTAYEEASDGKNGILRASLYCVTEPTEGQLERMKGALAKKYGKKRAEIKLVRQPELLGGFVLCVKDREEDWSLAGRLERLQQKWIGR